MDPMDSHVGRLPAFEDTEAYRAMCADRRTTPLERAPGTLAYTRPGHTPDPIEADLARVGIRVADLDEQAAAFVAYRRAQRA